MEIEEDLTNIILGRTKGEKKSPGDSQGQLFQKQLTAEIMKLEFRF